MISIHAPAWGATIGFFPMISCEAFQSTRPRGARRPQQQTPQRAKQISIHAPAWGATKERLL